MKNRHTLRDMQRELDTLRTVAADQLSQIQALTALVQDMEIFIKKSVKLAVKHPFPLLLRAEALRGPRKETSGSRPEAG